METKKFLTIIIGASVVILVGLSLIRSYQTKNPYSVPSQTKIAPTLISSPTPISKPAPVKTTTVRGTITAISGTKLTVNVNGQTQVLSIAKTDDFKKVTSGSVEKGDAVSAPSSASELKVGQFVSIVLDVGTTSVRSIYIIR